MVSFKCCQSTRMNMSNIKVHTLCLGFFNAHHDRRRRTVTLGDLICNYSSKEVISCKCDECSIEDEVKVYTNITVYPEILSIKIDCICQDEDTHSMVQIKTAVNVDVKTLIHSSVHKLLSQLLTTPNLV